jgi:hypothetical protein
LRFKKEISSAVPPFFAPNSGLLCVISTEAGTGEMNEHLLALDPVTGEERARRSFGSGRLPVLVDPVTGDLLAYTGHYQAAGGSPRQPGWLGEYTDLRARFPAWVDGHVLIDHGDRQEWLDVQDKSLWTSKKLNGRSRLIRDDGRTAATLKFEHVSKPAHEFELHDLTTGQARPGQGAGGHQRLNMYSWMVGWPANAPALVASGGRLVRWDPVADVIIGEGPLSLSGLAMAQEGWVTSHDDGLRFWTKEGVSTGFLPRRERNPMGMTPLVASPARTRVAATGSAGTVVVEGQRVLFASEEVSVDVTWLDEDHLALMLAHDGKSALLDVRTGEQRALPAQAPGEVVRFGHRPAGGLYVATAARLDTLDVSGALVARVPLPKKLKGYRAPTEVRAVGSEVWVLANRRLFRWDATTCERALSSLDGELGVPKSASSPGPIEWFESAGDQLALFMRVKSHQARGVVGVHRVDERVLGWTGPLECFNTQLGDTWAPSATPVLTPEGLWVATDVGRLARFTLPH